MPFLRTALFHLIIAATVAAAPRPKLVLVVSVDQLSAELMERWGKDLPGGLGQLYRQGSTFLAAYQDHGLTETGPGHSVLLTGRYPSHTGIVENTWLDRESGKRVYCVADPKAPLVGDTPSGPGASPASLKGDTLGRWLLDQIPGSRVFAVTGKDRSAILMAGHQAQGVYWFTGSTGFSSSTAYTQALPSWLTTYNAGFQARMELNSLSWSALDGRDLPLGGSYRVHGQELTMGLPRVLLAEGEPRDRAFWDRFRASPYLDQAIFGAAQALEAGEHLGQGPGVDLLALGLSGTDYVGHSFGNGGPEMVDNLRRIDLELGAYLEQLRAHVPELWVLLTADHGCKDFPERLQAQGLPAKRLQGTLWQHDFNLALSKRLGSHEPFFALNPGSHQLYLNPEALRHSGKSHAQVLRAAVAVAKASPEVAQAYSAEDLEHYRPETKPVPGQGSYQRRLSRSYLRGRSGDLLLAFKPDYMLDDPGHVCGHGHPQPYDQHVPLIFMGPWRAETRSEPVSLVDLAPTLARELGIKPEQVLDGHPLELKLKEHP